MFEVDTTKNLNLIILFLGNSSSKSQNKFIYAVPILVLLLSILIYYLFGETIQSFFNYETEDIEESQEEIKEELSFLRARVHKLAENL